MADSKLRIVIEALNDASDDLKAIAKDTTVLGKETDALTAAQNKAAQAMHDAEDAALELASAQAALEANTGSEKQHELEGAVLDAKVSLDEARDAAAKYSGQLETVNDTNEKGKFSFTELNSAIGLAKQAYQGLQQLYGASISPTLELASAQRELALAGQISVEEAGELIQVADDLKITSDQLKTAFKAMTQDGLQPSIANIKAIAERYQAASSPTDRLTIAQDGLGRAYQDLIPLLELTPQKIDAMAQSASAAGLVMSGEAVQAARDYELAIDGLTDSWQAFTVEAGSASIPTLTRIIEVSNEAGDRARALSAAYEAGLISANEHMAALQFGNLSIINQTMTTKELQQAIEGATAGLVPYTSYIKELPPVLGSARDALTLLNGETQRQKDLQLNLPQVWSDARTAIAGLNITTEKRIELEQRLALASGAMTAEDILRQESVNNLTAQYESGMIKQDEYFAKLEELAGGAVTTRTSFEEMGHGTVNFKADADKAIPTITKTAEELDKESKALLTASQDVEAYGKLLEEQQQPGGPFYRYIVGLSQITGEALAAGAAIRNIPGLPGGFTGAPGSTGGGGIKAAEGLDITVPAGYPNDSFGPIWAQSGEKVQITPAGETTGSGHTFIFNASDDVDIELIARRVVELMKAG